MRLRVVKLDELRGGIDRDGNHAEIWKIGFEIRSAGEGENVIRQPNRGGIMKADTNLGKQKVFDVKV